MAKHNCSECRHMKDLQDSYGRTFYFCMFAHSSCFLEEVGVCGECELDETSEEWYQELEVKNDDR